MTMSRTDAVHDAPSAIKWPGLVTGLNSFRSELLHLLGFSFAMNLLVLAVPIFMIQVFDRVLTSHSIETLTLLAIGTVAALLMMTVLDVIRGRILVRSASAFEQSLTANLVSNNQIQRYGDIAKLRNFINGPAMTTCLDMPWVPLFIALIFVIHPTLGWIALCGAMTMLTLAFLSEKICRSDVIALRRADDLLSRFSHQLGAHTLPPIVSSSSSGMEETWHSKQQFAIIKRTALLDRLQTSAAIGRFLRLVLQIALISGAAVLVTSGQLTAGGMIAASVIAARALGPIERTQEAWRAMVDARAQFSRLAQIHIHQDQSQNAFPVSENACLDVEGLAYMTPTGSHPLFTNVAFNLTGGQILGISGASNSGKSTLACLLAGLHRPTQGRVRLDKQDVFRSSDDTHGPNVAYLPQVSTLLPGTITQNITCFADVPLDQVHQAAQLAGIDDAILDLPNGYETEINPGQSSLSAGVSQRILLARAYCQQARLLILDEPYTHLDNAGVSSLLSALTELRSKGCIIVLISQRPSLLAQCDKVMILQDGQARFIEKRKRAELTVLQGAPTDNAVRQPMEAAQ